MEVDLLIVDYRIEGFLRYAVSLCEELRKINPAIKIAGCYMTTSNKQEVEGFDYIICALDYDLNPERIIQHLHPKAVLTFAHRFFDYMFTIEAHKCGLQVFNFQHGIYQSNTTVSNLAAGSLKLLLQKKKEKISLYCRCISYIAGKDPIVIAKIYAGLLKRQSMYYVINTVVGTISNADISFIYGEYWKSYFRTQYLESNTRYEIVGYPELEQCTEKVNKNCFKRKTLQTICYLAQSSVEDATLKREEMVDFLRKMEILLEKYNLLIKFHPRSDKTMYQCLLREEYEGCVSIWEGKDFPVADGYIGHESAVVVRAMKITGRVLIARLRENRISPFEEYTDYVCGVQDNLSAAMDEMMEKSVCKINSNMDDFVFCNRAGAIKQTAEIMLRSENFIKKRGDKGQCCKKDVFTKEK